MRINNGKTVIMDGTVKNIHPKQDPSTFTFDLDGDSKMTVEFKNGSKNNRADRARKMMLNFGEHVIVVGSTEKENHSFLYGYSIKRKGMISSPPMYVIKGDILKTKKCYKSLAVEVLCDGKSLLIQLPVSSKNGHIIKEGDVWEFMCTRDASSGCTTCRTWNNTKCSACTKKKKIYKYSAIQATPC